MKRNDRAIREIDHGRRLALGDAERTMGMEYTGGVTARLPSGKVDHGNVRHVPRENRS